MDMKSSVIAQQFKLAAIDLDGTLLGARPRNQPGKTPRAVRQLQQAGRAGRARLRTPLPKTCVATRMRCRASNGLFSCQGGESAERDADHRLETAISFRLRPPGKSSRRPKRRASPPWFTLWMAFSPPPIGILICSFNSDLAGRQPRQLPAPRLLDQPAFKNHLDGRGLKN